MASIADTLFSTESSRVEELISKSVVIFLPTLDPFWSDVITTNQGVTSADMFGRDWDLLRVFFGGLTGVIEGGRPRNDFPLHGDSTGDLGAKLFTQQTTQTFPDAGLGPNQKPYRLRIPMRSMVSNIRFGLGELVAETNEGLVGEIIAPKLTAFARNWAHTICNYWYLNQNGTYRLSNIGTVTAPSGAGPYQFSFTPSNNAIHRFYPGQRVDLYRTDFATRVNDIGGTRQEVYVGAVDELKNTVVAYSITDPTTWASGIPAIGDSVVYAGSIQTADGSILSANDRTGFAGWNSYMKTNGSTTDNFILGPDSAGFAANDRIDVSVHPEFASYFVDFQGNPLTEFDLHRHIQTFQRAKSRYNMSLDTFASTDGVWTKYLETEFGSFSTTVSNGVTFTQPNAGELLRRRGVNPGETISMRNEGVQDGFFFTVGTETYKGFTSHYISSGELYGTRMAGNNWQVHVPPEITGSSPLAGIEKGLPFRFVGGALTGTSSTKIPVKLIENDTPLITEQFDMPGWMRMQIAPRFQFAGLKLFGIDESRAYQQDGITVPED